MYKSTDAGKSWTHLGLRDAQQIPRIAVDPGNPDRLFVAALGHPYGPNAERGIFRSTDGGKSFEKVLFKDEYTGGADVVFAPKIRTPSTLRFGQISMDRGRTAASAAPRAVSSRAPTVAARGSH